MFGLFACCAPKVQTAAPEQATEKAQQGPAAIEHALAPQAIAVVSIACCGMGSKDDDAKALRAVSEGLQLAQAPADALLISAMDAQRYAGNVPRSADPAVKRLVQQIVALYTQHGFAAFPIILIDRKVAFYGGVPTAEQFAQRHRRLMGERLEIASPSA
jgi:hypothetical protein